MGYTVDHIRLYPHPNVSCPAGSIDKPTTGWTMNNLLPVNANKPLLPNHQKWGSVQQFSLGIQHEFPGNNLLSVSYVGTLGRHLGRIHNLNQVPVGVGTMNVPALDDTNTPHCDAKHNCAVQEVLISTEQPNIFFVPYRGYSDMTTKEYPAVSSYNGL